MSPSDLSMPSTSRSIHGLRCVLGLCPRYALVEPTDLLRTEHEQRSVTGIRKNGSCSINGLVHGGNGFDRKSFCQEDVLPVILFKSRDIPNTIALTPRCTEILLAQKTSWSSRGMSPDIDVEANGPRVSSGRSRCPEVRLSRMDCVIAFLVQERWQGFGMNCTSIPEVGQSPFMFHFGNFKVGCLRSLVASFFNVQLVTRCRAAFSPVIRLTRVGEHTLHAYACVNFSPEAARRSMFGVRYRWFSGVTSGPKSTEVSCHPMSSTRKRTMLGAGCLFLS